MNSIDIFPDGQNDLALTTPEIFKMLDSPTFPLQNEMEDNSYPGFMADYDNDLSTIVSPNSACYGIDSTIDSLRNHHQQHQHQPHQLAGYQQYPQFQSNNDIGYCSSSNASFPASPENMMPSHETMTLNNFNLQDISLAASPADSHLSNDSGTSFYNLDQPIKTEPQDSTFPSMIDELNGQNLVPQQGMMQPVMQYSTQYTAQGQLPVQQQQQQQQQQQYQTIEQSFCYTENYMPTTVSNMQLTTAVMVQPQQQQQQQQIQPQQTLTMEQSMPSTSSMPAVHVPSVSSAAGRKRGAAGVFVSTSGDASTSSANKKQRMTKRQKQQMMDRQVEEYTQKNKDLKQQIELLERKVHVCTQFLQKYVSPIVQGRTIGPM